MSGPDKVNKYLNDLTIHNLTILQFYIIKPMRGHFNSTNTIKRVLVYNSFNNIIAF